jgi:hypothetical protein
MPNSFRAFQHLSFERVLLVFGQFQIFFLKAVGVGNENAAFTQVADIGFESCGIHDHECVEVIAWSGNVVGGKVNLKPRDPEECTAWSANFRGIVRKRSNIVSEQRAGVAEL